MSRPRRQATELVEVSTQRFRVEWSSAIDKVAIFEFTPQGAKETIIDGQDLELLLGILRGVRLERQAELKRVARREAKPWPPATTAIPD